VATSSITASPSNGVGSGGGIGSGSGGGVAQAVDRVLVQDRVEAWEEGFIELVVESQPLELSMARIRSSLRKHAKPSTKGWWFYGS